MQGFSWVVEGKLAGMPRPGDGESLDADLEWLSRKGIRLLFTLTESPLSADRLAAHDIASVHLPVRDFTPPTVEQLHQFVEETRVANANGKAVGVHCRAGIGRTGTFLAAWLVADGFSPVEAIRRIRRLRPGSIETPEQEDVIHEFDKYLKSTGRRG